jgi:hypothetical protein
VVLAQCLLALTSVKKKENVICQVYVQAILSDLFKYIESQRLNCLARDLLSEVICDPHVEQFGDPWARYRLASAVSSLRRTCV